MNRELREQVQYLTETSERVVNMQKKNKEIREALAKNREIMSEIGKLRTAAVNCIDIVGKDSQQVDDSAISSLTSLDFLSSRVGSEKAGPASSDVRAMLFHKLLSMIVNLKRIPESQLSAVTLCKLEEDINEWLYLIEKDRIIPKVPEDASWKAQFKNRKPRIV